MSGWLIALIAVGGVLLLLLLLLLYLPAQVVLVHGILARVSGTAVHLRKAFGTEHKDQSVSDLGELSGETYGPQILLLLVGQLGIQAHDVGPHMLHLCLYAVHLILHGADMLHTVLQLAVDVVKIGLTVLNVLACLDQGLLVFFQVLLQLRLLGLQVLYLLAVLCAHRHTDA